MKAAAPAPTATAGEAGLSDLSPEQRGRSSSVFPILAAPFLFVHTGLIACVFARKAQAYLWQEV